MELKSVKVAAVARGDALDKSFVLVLSMLLEVLRVVAEVGAVVGWLPCRWPDDFLPLERVMSNND